MKTKYSFLIIGTVLLVLLLCLSLYILFILISSDSRLIYSTNISLGHILLLILTFLLVYIVIFIIYGLEVKHRIQKLDSHSNNLLQQKNPTEVNVSNLQAYYQEHEKQLKEQLTMLSTKLMRIEEDTSTYQAILHSLADGMVITDLQGNILIINTVARQLLELRTTSHPVGQSIFTVGKYFQENGSELLKEEHPIFISLMSGQKWTTDIIVYTLDSKKKIINITSTVITTNNKRVGAIAIMRDITKEKEIDRMKTEFISLASHQLRTPLTAIKWFTNMLLKGDAGPLNTEQNEFTKNISDSTERMIELVNSLLNISRIESGRILIDPKPTDLKELVESIVKELQIKTNEKKQVLIVSVHDELPKINIDPSLIRQVYLNLLTNAIKYSPENSEISVFISHRGSEIISQVSDSGVGIPKDQQDKVFQKFFRAENVAKIETDGSGLGLYLIKAIIESSHGKIWFNSEESKGTTFWFSLPLSGMQPKKGEVTLDS